MGFFIHLKKITLKYYCDITKNKMILNSEIIDLNVVIVNYRSWEKLDKCLNSIKNQKSIPKSIVVVDNYSNDKVISGFKERFTWVHWIQNDENYGFSKGCNIGAENTKTKWLLFLNPDTIIPKDCFTTLIPYCDLNEKFHLITIKQLDQNSKNTHPYGIFPNTLNLFPLFRSIERNFIKYKQSKRSLSKNKIGFPDWISGSFILIRNVDFKKINKWDEDYWMYCEDIDLSRKAFKLGLNRVILNSWKCTHTHGGASRIDQKTKIKTKTEVVISTYKYINKNFYKKFRLVSICSYLMLKFLELIIQAPFSIIKRRMLISLITYFIKIKKAL